MEHFCAPLGESDRWGMQDREVREGAKPLAREDGQVRALRRGQGLVLPITAGRRWRR